MTSDEIRSINHGYEMALRNLNSRAWAAMSDSEKINLLQAIEDKNAMDQKRIACEVLSEPMPPDERGCHVDNLIIINSDLLNDPDIFGTTKTLCHEGSHAMDMQARYFPEVRSQFTPEQLAARGTPIPNPDIDMEGYWNHPAEVAAREAGERGAEKIMSDREHVLAVDRQMNAEHPTNQILQTFDYIALDIPIKSENAAAENASPAADTAHGAGETSPASSAGLDAGNSGIETSAHGAEEASPAPSAGLDADSSGIDASEYGAEEASPAPSIGSDADNSGADASEEMDDDLDIEDF